MTKKSLFGGRFSRNTKSAKKVIFAYFRHFFRIFLKNSKFSNNGHFSIFGAENFLRPPKLKNDPYFKSFFYPKSEEGLMTLNPKNLTKYSAIKMSKLK